MVYSCIWDFLFVINSPVDAVCWRSGRRTTRSARQRIQNSLAVKVGFGKEFGGVLRPPCVRHVVPPPPLRDENALPACSVRGSIGRLKNACVSSCRWRRSCARSVCSRWFSASRLRPSLKMRMKQVQQQQQRAPFYGKSPLQRAERRLSQVAWAARRPPHPRLWAHRRAHC